MSNSTAIKSLTAAPLVREAVRQYTGDINREQTELIAQGVLEAIDPADLPAYLLHYLQREVGDVVSRDRRLGMQQAQTGKQPEGAHPEPVPQTFFTPDSDEKPTVVKQNTTKRDQAREHYFNLRIAVDGVQKRLAVLTAGDLEKVAKVRFDMADANTAAANKFKAAADYMTENSISVYGEVPFETARKLLNDADIS